MHAHLAGPGFKHRLLTNLQDLARRSLLHIKCSLHLTLQSDFPLWLGKAQDAEHLTHSVVGIRWFQRVLALKPSGAMPRCERLLAQPSLSLARRAVVSDSVRSTQGRACLTPRLPRNH